MTVTIEPLSLADREEIIDIFNHYALETFAAFSETAVPYEMFESFMLTSWNYPAVTSRDENLGVTGFGMLRPYSAIPAFARTAELTCFMREGYTGRGTGTLILRDLESKALEIGISTILALVSSLNPGSLHFHLKNGFTESGRLIGIGEKKGRLFDVIYCQKSI